MKSPHAPNKSRFDAVKATSNQEATKLLVRRLSDITPASRAMSTTYDVPTSPKLHELLERSKLN